MTKKEAVTYFKDHYLPGILLVSHPNLDLPALREAWNNFTDSLCKDGAISSRQYETWTHPNYVLMVHTYDDTLLELQPRFDNVETPLGESLDGYNEDN